MLFLALIWARPGKGCSVCSGKWRYDFFGLCGLSALASTARMGGATSWLWMQATVMALRSCLAQAALSGQMMQRGTVSLHHRARGAERLIELVSNPALPGFSAPKLQWIRDNEPEIFARDLSLLHLEMLRPTKWRGRFLIPVEE